MRGFWVRKPEDISNYATIPAPFPPAFGKEGLRDHAHARGAFSGPPRRVKWQSLVIAEDGGYATNAVVQEVSGRRVGVKRVLNDTYGHESLFLTTPDTGSAVIRPVRYVVSPSIFLTV